MKRKTISILSAVLATVALTACGNSGASADASTANQETTEYGNTQYEGLQSYTESSDTVMCRRNILKL